MRDFLDTQELADYLGVPPKTVRMWRYKGTGPRAVKLGGHLRYRVADIQAWVEAHADPVPAA